MKLRNKRTGEIEEFENISRVFKFIGNQNTYSSLAELNEEWEDYEEDEKEHYTLNSTGQIWTTECFNEETIKNMKSVGNYFETKEEAEKAVEKLKAWKRLEDKGLKFEGYSIESGHNEIIFNMFLENKDSLEKAKPDLDLLFGGEE